MIRAAYSGERKAAFFDVDGTLIAGPSLERRFRAALRFRRAIRARNYVLWAAHAAWLAPRGIAAIVHGNKMYLRNLATCRPCCAGAVVRTEDQRSAPAKVAVHVETAVEHALCDLFFPFFPAAIDQAAWHASAGHAIVLVTGTLAPLAHEVATALAMRLAARGRAASIGVCATRLEQTGGRWTGRILGDAMFGEAKARAVRQIASAEDFDLTRCYAYGDSTSDRWMLAAVGHPAAVNPSPELQRIASLYDWPVLLWKMEGATSHGNTSAEYARWAAQTETGTRR